MTQNVCNIFKTINVSIDFKHENCTQNVLYKFSAKIPLPSDNIQVIYGVPCKDYDFVYIYYSGS